MPHDMMRSNTMHASCKHRQCGFCSFAIQHGAGQAVPLCINAAETTSFHVSMLLSACLEYSASLQGDASAAAAADSLVAEEASVAAKAAAKKAKKQKAKARRQQARSDATSGSASTPAASEPSASAEASLHRQQHAVAMATQHQSSPSGSTGQAMPPNQDTAGLQAQLQHMTAHDSAVHAALDEQVVTSAAGGSPTGKAATVDASQGDDARFLNQLFCCPITKVLLPSYYPYLHPPPTLPTHPPLSPPIPHSSCPFPASSTPVCKVERAASDLCF